MPIHRFYSNHLMAKMILFFISAMNAKYFLLQALELAKIRRGFCAPNPSVGAVVVSETGEVLAMGYHLGAGYAHAEVDALKKINGKARGAVIYITLEPCCHWGKTPPCTDAIIQAGIKHVVYGFADPNPLVSQKSKAILAAENISCEYVAVPEIMAFYASYQYWQMNKKPWVTAKIALSLDGKIAGKKGEPMQITGPELKKLTHECRQRSDAILTTAKTIILDDPQMNVRRTEIIAKPVYILDRELKLPLHAKIFSTAKSITLFHAKNISANQIKIFTEKNVRCVAVDVEQNKLNLMAVMKHIGEDGVHDLWVEAGGTCFAELARQQLLQKILIYVAPRWLGSGVDAFDKNFSLDIAAAKVSWQQIGNDVVCEIIF